MPKKTATKTASKSKVKKATSVSATSEPRRLTLPTYRWYDPRTWRYAVSPDDPRHPIPKARHIFMKTVRQLQDNWRLFGGIVLIFGVLNLILVKGASGGYDISSLKDSLDGAFKGVGGKLTGSLVGFVYVVANSGGSSDQNSSIYRTILILVCSLAFVWALRQVLAGKKIKIRDGFYQGMYPLIPFSLVIGLIGIQLLPLAIGGGIYSTVATSGIAAHLWERLLWLVLFVGLAAWSLRMVTASLFALYIVTLPDMTPMRAYRSARELVSHRRLQVWRKLIFLPTMLLLVAVVIELPLILFVTPLAVWSFFILSMCTLPVVNGYLYNLYRELL
jgi:hypothetical protein